MPQNTKKNRAPVVVVMGHIDHGKSTLLDYIRKANVVAGEAGGITQHVGAYEAEHTSQDSKKHTITFLDTPGHEAFCSIRERGAKAADIAILVVSAEDGVKPQTIEAHKAILAQKIPYIVAISKIDKPNADIDRTKQSLGENEIYVEGWGGDIPCVPISAVSGKGIDELLEMIILMSEMVSLNYDADSPASGTIVESERDSRKGISATLLIQDGTLKTGTFVVSGTSFAPVRYIENFNAHKINEAKASQPVVIVGWNEIPSCGQSFATVETKKEAEKLCEQNKMIEKSNKKHTEVKTEKVAENLVTIPIIVKADVIGSLDGVMHELTKIKNDKVVLKIVTSAIGEINENDVKMALGDPNIIILGFNVEADKKAAPLIERSPVTVKTYKIIYELVEYVRELVKSKVPKEYVEEMTGRAKILALFSKEKDKQVIGGKVESGFIESGNDIRIMRREVEIGRGKIRELQEKKVRTKEVREGHEFGVLIEAKIEIAPGDRVEAVKTVEKNG